MAKDSNRNDVEQDPSQTHFDEAEEIPDHLRGEINRGRFMPVLICLAGPYYDTPLLIMKERTTLGRVETCDIQLNRPNISRIHCIIKYMNNQSPENMPVCLIYDNQSTNGTFMRGESVREERLLVNGETFNIGDFTFGYFIRRETEVIMEQKAREAMNRYSRKIKGVRVTSQYEVTINILLPDQSFTPRRISGVTHDISMKGIRFYTEEISKDFFQSILEGNRYLRCDLIIKGAKDQVRVSGRMAWVNFDHQVTPNTTTMGIEFKELTPELELAIGEELGLLSGNDTLREED